MKKAPLLFIIGLILVVASMSYLFFYYHFYLPALRDYEHRRDPFRPYPPPLDLSRLPKNVAEKWSLISYGVLTVGMIFEVYWVVDKTKELWEEFSDDMAHAPSSTAEAENSG